MAKNIHYYFFFGDMLSLDKCMFDFFSPSIDVLFYRYRTTGIVMIGLGVCLPLCIILRFGAFRGITGKLFYRLR